MIRASFVYECICDVCGKTEYETTPHYAEGYIPDMVPRYPLPFNWFEIDGLGHLRHFCGDHRTQIQFTEKE